MKGESTPTPPHRWDERTWKEGYARGFADGATEGQYQAWRSLRARVLARLAYFGADLGLGLYHVHTSRETWHELAIQIEDTVNRPCTGQQHETQEPVPRMCWPYTEERG